MTTKLRPNCSKKINCTFCNAVYFRCSRPLRYTICEKHVITYKKKKKHNTIVPVIAFLVENVLIIVLGTIGRKSCSH